MKLENIKKTSIDILAIEKINDRYSLSIIANPQYHEGYILYQLFLYDNTILEHGKNYIKRAPAAEILSSCELQPVLDEFNRRLEGNPIL